MSAAAINVRRLLHRFALRAAVFALRHLARARRVRAFLGFFGHDITLAVLNPHCGSFSSIRSGMFSSVAQFRIIHGMYAP
jgi:hypothetical protein